MGIADTEQQILEELQQLSDEPEQDKKESEELLEEVAPKEEESEEESGEEVEEESNEESEEEATEEPADDGQVEEESNEEEDIKPGAKMRHKLKEAKKAEADRTRENQELRERLARLEGRADATPPVEAVKEEIPDAEYEPEKFAQYQNGKLEKRVQEMEASQRRVNAERQWETMQSEHARTNPDYNDAKQFLIEHETKKIKERNPYATDAQIAQVLKEAEYQEAGNAAKAGIVPTAHIEFLAYQAGYRSESKKEAPKKKPNIKEIKKNAKKNASLIGGSSAGETGDGRTAQQLLDMSMDDMHKFGKDKFEKAIRKIEARS